MTDYFADCPATTDGMKKAYHELCKKHHPDKGGDLRTMQEINRQYQEWVKFGKRFTASAQQAESNKYDEARRTKRYSNEDVFNFFNNGGGWGGSNFDEAQAFRDAFRGSFHGSTGWTKKSEDDEKVKKNNLLKKMGFNRDIYKACWTATSTCNTSVTDENLKFYSYKDVKSHLKKVLYDTKNKLNQEIDKKIRELEGME